MQLSQFLANPAALQRHFLKDIHEVGEFSGATIYKLENGGIVEVTMGYVGYIGYRKKALLFPDGGRWKLWIEGKKSFPVDVLKAPTAAPTYVMGVGDVLDLLE